MRNKKCSNHPPATTRWFEYDQLNRIKVVNSYSQSSVTNNLGSSLVSTTDYYEKYRYDANGNILHAKRNGHTTGAFTNNMDDMDYNYISNTNQLSDVNDPGDNASPLLSQFGDVKTETSGNYTYDLIGNLVTDAQEEIANIDWNVYGKIKKITRTNTSFKPDLEFRYDAAGNRICKISKTRLPKPGGLTAVGTEENWAYTYYVRDAQGNVMAVYNRGLSYNSVSGLITDVMGLSENHVYGSSRLAIANRAVTTASYQSTFSSYNCRNE